MKKILILGANGQIARFAIDLFLKTTDFELMIFISSMGIYDEVPGSVADLIRSLRYVKA